MFRNSPKILAHKSVFNAGHYSTPEYIVTDAGDGSAFLHNRYCPHRMYPIADPGAVLTGTIECHFHGLQWTPEGIPIGHDRKIKCGNAAIGKSGLIFRDFIEPEHQWVSDLAAETELVYSHFYEGSSKGSWLWLMDAEVDYLHIRKGGIHPRLVTQIDLSEVRMEEGENWIFQQHCPDWWGLFIYPNTFIEHKPGCLSVNYTVPNDINSEWGFDWITQFYYAPHVSKEDRIEFETLESVLKEDVAAIEKIKVKFFPVVKPMSKYEDHCVHWGNWIRKNLAKQ